MASRFPGDDVYVRSALRSSSGRSTPMGRGEVRSSERSTPMGRHEAPSPPHGTEPAGSSGPSAEGLHQREMVRLHALWERTKAELREANARLAGGGAPTRQHEQAVSQLTSVVDELKDKIRFSELQLAASREEGEGLAGQIHELRAALGESQSRVAELGALRVQATNCARGEAAALERLKEEARRSDEIARNFEHANRQHDSQTSRLRDELRRATEMAHASGRALSDATARADTLGATNQDLTRQLLALKEQLKTVHVARRTDAHAMTALHQLQLDNQRLVRLLASTAEYKQFITYSDDSGGLAYLPPDPLTGADAAKAPLPKSAGRDRRVSGPGREADFWVPGDAYALMSDFRNRHVPAVPMAAFSDLLLKLGRVWKAREAKTLERVREAHARRVSELRRRLAQQVPYDEVVTSSEVERLRRELRAERAAAAGGGRRLNSSDEGLLESLLGSVEELNRKLRHAAHANNELRIELAEQAAAGHAAHSSGAAAAAAAAVAESDRLASRLHELMREFTTKTMALSRSDGDLLRKVLRLQSWFLEAVERRVVAGRERFATVHEAAASGPRADADHRPEQPLASPLGEGRHSSYEPSYSYRPPPPPGPGSAWTAAGADLDSCSDYSDDAHRGEAGVAA